jgi:RNA-dependent RNA polymerase
MVADTKFRFVKPFKVDEDWVTAATIVSSIGTFNNLIFDPNLIYCPAQYVARQSQAFRATSTVKVVVDEVINIDDICTRDGKYQFTDGVGTRSKELSRNIWAQLKKTKH